MAEGRGAVRRRVVAVHRRKGPVARESAMCLSDPQAAFLALHAGDGGGDLRGSARDVSQGGGNTVREFGARAHERILLRGGVDATHGGGAVHTDGGYHSASAGQHGTAGRRSPGAARARKHSGVDGYSYAVQPAAGLSADAGG